MKRSLFTLAMLFALSVFMGGCGSTGLTASGHVTNVQLAGPNFRIVATNVSGEASSKAILGVSYGLGITTTQLALIPLTPERLLYKIAMKNLWSGFEASNGSVANRKLALVNVRYDSESLNLFLYTKVTTVIVADVIEFQ